MTNTSTDLSAVYCCRNCNLLWLKHQLVVLPSYHPVSFPVLVCIQDGGSVDDVTETQRGQEFLRVYKSMFLEEEKSDGETTV